jgi:hypothetical protein
MIESTQIQMTGYDAFRHLRDKQPQMLFAMCLLVVCGEPVNDVAEHLRLEYPKAKNLESSIEIARRALSFWLSHQGRVGAYDYRQKFCA